MTQGTDEPFELSMEQDGVIVSYLLPDPVRSQANAVASMCEARGLNKGDGLFVELGKFLRMLASLEKEIKT